MTRIQIRDIPEEWVEEADRRDLSLREYGERMIRAGRRQFGHDYKPSEVPTDQNTLKHAESSGSEVEKHLKMWIHVNLSANQALDIEDLLDLLKDDLVKLADELQDENKAKYRRSRGGYIKTSDE